MRRTNAIRYYYYRVKYTYKSTNTVDIKRENWFEIFYYNTVEKSHTKISKYFKTGL